MPAITIPEDTSRLIESVYDTSIELDLPAGVDTEQLEALLVTLERQRREAQAKAGQDLILAPTERRLLDQQIRVLEEDDPEAHETLRAQTRDIDFSVTVVCLHQDEAGLFVYNGNYERVTINLEAPPQPDQTKLLLQNTVSIQNKWIGMHFVQQQPPQSWNKNSALRYCRHAIFVNEYCDLPKYQLKLSQDFGLETIKKEAL